MSVVRSEPVPSSSATIVDVLENALEGDLSSGRVQSLAMRDVRILRDVVIEFYDAWAPYPPPEDTLRADPSVAGSRLQEAREQHETYFTRRCSTPTRWSSMIRSRPTSSRDGSGFECFPSCRGLK